MKANANDKSHEEMEQMRKSYDRGASTQEERWKRKGKEKKVAITGDS